MSEKRIFGYPGSEIDVQWEGRLCIHIGECGNAKGELFERGRDPWCLPDKSSKEDVREVASGYECGIGIENYNDIKRGDIIEAFTLEEEQPTL